MSTDAYIELVYRNLKGEIDPEDFHILNEMTAKDSSLANLRIEIEEAWDLSGEESIKVSSEQTRRLFERIKTSKAKSTSIFTLKNVITGIAAIFVLGLSAIWLLRDETEIYNEAGLIRLADNSMVELREGSRLVVAEMSDAIRKVRLSGEAYFDISPDANRPFSVESRGAKVEVLGTKFLVKETSSSVFLVVEEGKVKFSSNDSNSMLLEAGMKAECRLDGSLVEVGYKNLTGWQSGSYQYIDQTLSSVVKELAIIFDTEIIIQNDALSNCRINAILTADNLNGNLNQLAAQLEINAEYNGQSWILSGDRCQ